MKLVLSGNPLFQSSSSKIPPKPGSAMDFQPDISSQLSPGITPSTCDSGVGGVPAIHLKKKPNVVPSLTPVAAFAGLALLTVPLGLYLCKLKKANSSEPMSSLVIHPLDLFNSDNTVRISIAKDTKMLANVGSGSSESLLRHGGFGVVYKGQLDDGTKIAVKRMESGVICNKALDEFESVISVLTKVRHRHLVLLLGYSTQGLKRIPVYEYKRLGALSRHLFHWKNVKLERLSWKRRLSIALNVARGMEYLYTLAHQIFIHQDLKSSYILLGDDFRGKVSDFGLLKLIPDGGKSIMTLVARTFGYVAPEYAV
ncbi:putative protein kinase RLK-Pelle-LRR-IX family [Helianthus annuus]|nr:putative protein kinase RLK-Pelle-LRR-IX family [Helianthus annuus]